MFLDASKAFDRVNHWTLFRKLITRGVPMIFVRILAYWYQNQLFCIKWASTVSSFFTVSNGVRQGSILSPHLFALYVDDLSTQLNVCNNGCHLGDTSVNHLFYADDLCLLSPSAKGLQNLVDICQQYGSSHDIVYNPLKTECIVFKPQSYKLQCPAISLSGETVEFVSRTKYLGTVIHETLSDHEDMTKQLRLLYVRGNTLVRKFGKCSRDVLITLYRAYCANFYNISLWSNFSRHMYNKVKVACNNVCRKLFRYSRRDSARAMFMNLRCDNFDVIYRKSIYSFMTRMSSCANQIVQALNSTMSIIGGNLWSRWHENLYLVDGP